MTPQQKRAETLKKHKEARKKKEAEARAERKLIKNNLKEVLTSSEATPAEKLESSKLLKELDKG